MIIAVWEHCRQKPLCERQAVENYFQYAFLIPNFVEALTKLVSWYDQLSIKMC